MRISDWSADVCSSDLLLQAAPPLRRGALEQPAAAEREQRVAAEQRLGRREPVGDMAARMARHVEHPRRLAADIDALVVADGAVDAGDAVRVGLRAADGAAGGLLQGEVAAALLGMEIGRASCRERVWQCV